MQRVRDVYRQPYILLLQMTSAFHRSGPDEYIPRMWRKE